MILSDAFRSDEENEGIGGLHKQAGKMTPGCWAKTSMSSQLPFNTEAMLALAPSKYGVGVNVYIMADRMYPCDPANTQKINKALRHFERRWLSRLYVIILEQLDISVGVIFCC